MAEVARHTGNVWTPVISLSRRTRSGWAIPTLKTGRSSSTPSITDIAKGYKIHPDRLRWYAAMHEKEKHIHVHMVLFSTDPKEGYLSRQGIRSIKSALVSTIYRNDRLHIYEKKDHQRSTSTTGSRKHRWRLSSGRWQSVHCRSGKLELLRDSSRPAASRGQRQKGLRLPAAPCQAHQWMKSWMNWPKDERVAARLCSMAGSPRTTLH